MIHPHLKSNEELLSIWNGDFHDIDQMQALEQLARRRVDDFSEQLKLQHLFINKLKDKTTYICDFESYIMRCGNHDHLQTFEEAIEHKINKDYIEFLKQNKETSRLMAIDSQIAKMKNMFHQSFVNWLYGINHPSAKPINR